MGMSRYFGVGERPDAPTATWIRSGRERPAEQCDSLRHADQPVPGLVRGGRGAGAPSH
jgi:hypothetical protein